MKNDGSVLFGTDLSFRFNTKIYYFFIEGYLSCDVQRSTEGHIGCGGLNADDDFFFLVVAVTTPFGAYPPSISTQSQKLFSCSIPPLSSLLCDYYYLFMFCFHVSTSATPSRLLQCGGPKVCLNLSTLLMLLLLLLQQLLLLSHDFSLC